MNDKNNWDGKDARDREGRVKPQRIGGESEEARRPESTKEDFERDTQNADPARDKTNAPLDRDAAKDTTPEETESVTPKDKLRGNPRG